MRPTTRDQSIGKAKNRKVRILLVDDHRIIRDGLANLLRRDRRLEIVGQASNGREGVELVREVLPDIVLMDIVMPEMDGIEATRIITSQWPEIRVVALSMFDSEDARKRMLEAGACAYLTKSVDFSLLLSTLYNCARIDPLV